MSFSGIAEWRRKASSEAIAMSSTNVTVSGLFSLGNQTKSRERLDPKFSNSLGKREISSVSPTFDSVTEQQEIAEKN